MANEIASYLAKRDKKKERMDKHYRPKHWESIKQDYLYDPDSSDYRDEVADWAFEMGADAILNTLKKLIPLKDR